MASTIEALLHLQSIERQLAHIRHRLRSRENAVSAQERRIGQLQGGYDALHEKVMEKRKEGDQLDLDLKSREERVSKLRTGLNTARTNKEYAAILMQINTHKADNSKIEEQALRIMQEADAIQAEADEMQARIEAEQGRLDEIRQSSRQEIEKLNGMMEDLSAQRVDAVQNVPREALAVFERIAENYDGEAMAAVEIHGKKPPHQYVCGGCYMGLNAEHANALRVRDEIRRCDNCGRILYLAPQAEESNAH
jgi:predicted  nucleic acid-binding Zn-ribbon protein